MSNGTLKVKNINMFIKEDAVYSNVTVASKMTIFIELFYSDTQIRKHSWDCTAYSRCS